jgi:hypothetical protein
MTMPLRSSEAGEGEIQAFDGKVYQLSLHRAYAPGAPISVEVSREGGWLPLTMKSIGSKRQTDGSFIVRARPINLRRETRAWLIESFA